MNDLSKNTILPTKKICIFIIKNLKIDIFKSKGLVFLSVFHVLLHEMTKCNKRQNIYPKADCVWTMGQIGLREEKICSGHDWPSYVARGAGP